MGVSILARSGVSAEELFNTPYGLSYDDFYTLDTVLSTIDKADVTFLQEVGKGITIHRPIWSSPMDRVTEHEMGIAIALEGGIGVIHNNFKTPHQEAEEVLKVKRFENGIINDPLTVGPNMSLEEVAMLTKDSGVSSFPVTEDGSTHGKLVGLITRNDYSLRKHQGLEVKDRMVRLPDIHLFELPFKTDNPIDEANDELLEGHASVLPIVDKDGTLQSIVTRTDVEKADDYPLATRDSKGRLCVLFSCDTRDENAYPVLEACFGAGADGVIVDTSQGFTRYAFDMLRYVAQKYPDKLLVGGNVSTPEACVELAKLGVDVIRIGQGPGSICSTQAVLGKGNAQATAVYESAKYSPVPILADGGVKGPGDIYKALALGAKHVMVGSLAAGCEESPGKTHRDHEGNFWKEYRGMGSAQVLEEKAGARGYGRMPQGVPGLVPHKGSIHEYVPVLVDTVAESFYGDNCRTIEELHDSLHAGRLRFKQRTQSSLVESKPHSIRRD
jgi:IMP dehydrogenase